jgi:hypothetical protein
VNTNSVTFAHLAGVGRIPFLRKFAPHFAQTLQEMNTAPDDDLSDHFPITVDVPLTEPPLKKSP